eukprot:GHVR01033387.1.p1 GENE.GHVR01033387.1~~GHVR01033387.1.p1  ORF type:complete len:186 (-),score=43.53 GHVR01033387.1:283-840(-)
MKLKLLCTSQEAKELYANHGHFHEGDSGLDLYITHDHTINPGQTVPLKLSIKASAWVNDKNVSFLVIPRSSLAKTPLRLANSIGLIDAGYRGELMAFVDNIKTTPHTVRKGDRLFQAVSFNGDGITLELVDELDTTTRGSGGFGSTTTKETTNTTSNTTTNTTKTTSDPTGGEMAEKRSSVPTRG